MMLLVSLLAASLATWASPAPEASAEPPAGGGHEEAAPRVAFVGEFGFIGGQPQRDGLVEAIERSVQALPGLFHDLARKRLTEVNTIPGSVRMFMDGDDLVVIYGDQQPQRAPLDGSPRKWRNRDGDEIQLAHELRGGKLVQTTRGKGGHRVMVWSFDPERGLLRVKSTMASSRLPEPVRYRLTFKKR
jgi:hypothetical protein